MTYRSQLVASLAAAGLIATSSAAFAEAKVALMGGITGPIAGMAPAMIASMKLALDQANAAGLAIGKITYQEIVPEITQEPDYDAVIAAAKATL